MELPKVHVIREVLYGVSDEKGDAVEVQERLAPGDYEVDHLSPWGPVVTETNSLGHMLVVNWRDVEGGKGGALPRLQDELGAYETAAAAVS